MAEPTKVKTIGAIDIYFDGEESFYADIPDGPYRTKRKTRKTRKTLSDLERELSKQATPIRCFDIGERYGGVDRTGEILERHYGEVEPDYVWIHYHDVHEVTVTGLDSRTHRYRDKRGDLARFHDGPYIWDDATVESLQRIFAEERVQSARIAWALQEVMQELRKPTKDDFHPAPKEKEVSVPR